MGSSSAPKIETIETTVLTFPTDAPESDGTLKWDSTTMVLVEISAGEKTGIGYTYGMSAIAAIVRDSLAPLIEGGDPMDIAALWLKMVEAMRNNGRGAAIAMAIAAIDNALWDLKGKLLDQPVAALLGRAREEIPAYGSGGFTSYDDHQMTEQLGGWASAGFGMVKIKVGRAPERDPHRLGVARQAIGSDVALFMDANGAQNRKEALMLAERAAEFSVAWNEEPVSSDDLSGLRLLRDRGPAGMQITAGEYGYDIMYFRRMLEAGAVDVLQADATRCAGITGFMGVAALSAAHQTPLSAHCAPALHLHVCLAALPAVHLEWFHDHVRIEDMLFDGAPVPRGGKLRDNGLPGLGITVRPDVAERYRVG
ncbi:mandelate racemase [Defluviimonas sp. 20V17]|uniref:L-alanine-DL-glutamate epimerase n=1 Tax=Allgaiera indica TaxID=765699 RepID=A0AAN4UT56_9RHOB|nr:enolase C-terminal domain-like protein [Allgaiera indica]KDB01723.1 mandelate racemase [Defluviimonas sp. 20V17]GHE04055.1 mandelate racemase [Allgaiera indica]SDX33478.1 L-alanine-DL-glutamate epimerase [Allgaiera indica]